MLTTAGIEVPDVVLELRRGRTAQERRLSRPQMSFRLAVDSVAQQGRFLDVGRQSVPSASYAPFPPGAVQLLLRRSRTTSGFPPDAYNITSVINIAGGLLRYPS